MWRVMSLAAHSLQVLELWLTRTASGRAGVPLPALVRAAMVSWPFSELASLIWCHGLLANQSPFSLCHVGQVVLRFIYGTKRKCRS